MSVNPLNANPTTHKMVKHIQTICKPLPTICLSVFDHFVELVLKGLIYKVILKFPIKSCPKQLHEIRKAALVMPSLFCVST